TTLTTATTSIHYCSSSSPTRRPSELPRGGGEGEGGDADGHADPRRGQLPPRRRADPGRRHRPGARGPRVGVAGVGLAVGRGRERSEEQTSELQSRVDLVCPLLLERQ